MPRCHDGRVTSRRGYAATGLDHVRLYLQAAERFALTVAHADLRAPVAACPGWTAYDLACHLGNIHAWAATVVETGAAAPKQDDAPASPRPRAVEEWYVGKAGDLHQVLRAADPEAPCWNFVQGAAGRAGFWARRQLHETLVHTLDLGVGAPDLDAEVCADGVDEVLRLLLRRAHDQGRPARLSAPLCLAATDLGRAWTLSPRPPAARGSVPLQPRGSAAEAAPALVAGPPLVVERRHPGVDRLEAPAAALYALLWHRLPLDDALAAGAQVVGDEGRVRAFLASRLTP